MIFDFFEVINIKFIIVFVMEVNGFGFGDVLLIVRVVVLGIVKGFDVFEMM